MLAFAGNDPREPGHHQRRDGLGRPVHPGHRERLRRQGPGAPALLVPARPDGVINWQLNTTKAPFDDVEVRKALSMAIDRESIT